MVRPVEIIRKDLNALEAATATLAAEFSEIYATYLTVLGQAMRRQVIMATYHLCTQVYPEEFLVLSVSDRGRLQQAMQTLGRKGQGWLQQLLEPNSADPKVDLTQRLNSADLDRLETALASLVPSPKPEEGREDSPDEGTGPADDAEQGAESETIAADLAPEPLSAPGEDGEPEAPGTTPGIDPKALVQSVIMAAMANEVEESFSDRPFTGDPLTPTLVAKHHLMLEQMIRVVLERVSKKANNVLRKAGVIPDLPESVLEVASDADAAVAKGRAVPNVLNVLVAMAGDVATELDRPESDGEDAQVEIADLSEEDEEALEGTMTHLAAINLRLGDIEFGDVQSALWRSKLRTAVGRLRKLGKQYQRAERELAIAQAEQAWRSVWYDDASR
ncbi:hypothetical protein [Leptolyngbya sp. KIOST-1]|uniref:hypothetical protein n=1 Tax=Leptolyngbya sp. KIOST-1 TaxID=1229172 RepID=UPI00055A01D7|nr:hypothetical protein [Leptolyngbya sp. KIOST-1]